MMENAGIEVYRPEHRADFDRLNRAWILERFPLEPGDEAQLGDPESYFLSGGGQIFVLLSNAGRVIGTVAVMRDGDTWELAKMTVDAEHRGKGYGDKLLLHALAHIKNAGATFVELTSNTQQEAAIRMYRRHGFVEVPLLPGEAYERINIRMRREL